MIVPVGDVPTDVLNYAIQYHTKLGLNEWTIELKMDAFDGDDSHWGHYNGFLRGLYAVIKLNPNNDPARMRSTLVHELIHVATAPIEQAVLGRIYELVSKHLRDHVAALYRDADEIVTKRLEKALTPLLGAS